jgi:hypothetical protein
VSRLLAATLTALATVSSVQAALPFSMRMAPVVPINPNWQIAPGLPINQFAFNTAVIGRALRQVPPYAFGYNPYPNPIIAPGSFLTAGSGGYNPLSYNPYNSFGGGYGAGYGSPYLSAGYGGGYGGGYGPTLTTSGGATDYSPYGGNPYVPYYDPYGGALTGAANLTNAQGNWYKQIQEARIKQNEADTGKLELRRKIWEEAEWERKHTPTAEDVRQWEARYALNRAVMNPPSNEINSGKALNDIFDNLKDRQGAGGRGPNVPLDEDLLKKINVTAGGGGNIGLLKNDGNLRWPHELMDKDFTADREKLNRLFPDAVQQVKFNGSVGEATLNDIINSQKRLHETLNKKSIRDMTPNESIRARRYLYEIDEAIKALQDPNVDKLVNSTWAVKGKNVAEIVKYMTEKGIKFAPATQGADDAYRALHSALVAYYSGMPQSAPTPR